MREEIQSKLSVSVSEENLSLRQHNWKATNYAKSIIELKFMNIKVIILMLKDLFLSLFSLKWEASEIVDSEARPSPQALVTSLLR